MQAQPRLQTVHASQPARPPRSPKPQQSTQLQPQQSSKSGPNDRELTGWLYSAGSTKTILDLVQRHHQQFDKIHAVTALQTLTKLPVRQRSGFASHAAWPLLLATVQRLIPLYEPRQLSSAVSACGSLEMRPAWLPQLLSAAQVSMQARPEAWDLFSLSTCLVGLARLQYKGDTCVWTAAEQLLPRLLPGADSRDITNSVWSFSKREHVLGSNVIDAVCVRFLDVLPQTPPQGIANLLYGLASMAATPSPQLLNGCAERLASTAELSNSQNIANTIWALGELGHCPSTDTLWTLLQADALKVPTIALAQLTSSTLTHLCDFQASTTQCHSQILRGLTDMSFDPGQGYMHVAAQQLLASPIDRAVRLCRS